MFASKASLKKFKKTLGSDLVMFIETEVSVVVHDGTVDDTVEDESPGPSGVFNSTMIDPPKAKEVDHDW